MEPSELDTFHTDNMVCPHCGYIDEDSFEFEDDGGERDCHSCCEAFAYTRNISVTYTTAKIKPKQEG